jgi:primary-amine oxidase
MIDGIKNSVIETDVVASPYPTGSDENFAGNAFTTKSTVIKSTAEGERQYNADADRRWSIVNPSKTHYASGQASGYRVMTCAFPKLLAQPGSWVRRRAPFARSSLWVTPYAHGRDYPAGRFVPQSNDAPPDSLEGWMQGSKNLENEDLILFFTIGTNHIPRPEDWPVMPADMMRITFKPSSFFKQNPALDVPSTQAHGSKYAFGTADAPVPAEHVAHTEGNGTSCH